MHYTEPFLHKEKYPPTWKGDLINLVLFMVHCPAVFVSTFQRRTAGSTGRCDLVAGVVVGILLTLGQSIGWTGKKSRMVLHGAAMATSFPLIMIGLRYALKIEVVGLDAGGRDVGDAAGEYGDHLDRLWGDV